MLLADKDQLMKFDSAEAKSFRLRFRVPYKLFIILLDWTEAVIESKRMLEWSGEHGIIT